MPVSIIRATPYTAATTPIMRGVVEGEVVVVLFASPSKVVDRVLTSVEFAKEGGTVFVEGKVIGPVVGAMVSLVLSEIPEYPCEMEMLVGRVVGFEEIVDGRVVVE